MKMEDDRLTVGIITMHKVLNFGSALQAYALQRAVEQLGYKAEIIDYLYPNPEHCLYWELPEQVKRPKLSLLKRIYNKISQIKKQVAFEKTVTREGKFQSFYQTFFHLTAEQYSTRYWLGKKVPRYDIYLTGSDQVWNPRFVGYDTSFMLSFVQGAQPKISYASSFSIDILPKQYGDCYKHELSKYMNLSVREKSGAEIIMRLIGKEVEVCCDPTLLLGKEQWLEMANSSDYNIEEPYILLFVLDYAYDPYPYIFDIVESIHKKLNYRIIVLHGKVSEYMEEHHAKCIDNAGPADFIKLFSSAAFIITTSFHGTAFALKFRIPFVSVVKTIEEGDSRMYYLLKRVGAEKRALLYNGPIAEKMCDLEVWDQSIDYKLEQFRHESYTYLKKALSLAAIQVKNN